MADRTCAVEDCECPVRANGYCRMHNYRLWSTGTLDLTGMCFICGASIPYKGKGRRQTLCAKEVCRKAYAVKTSTKWRQRNPGSARDAKRRWVEANPERHSMQIRAAHLRREYGLTVEDYDLMLASQGGGCAICGATEGNFRRKRLAVDHDHKTGAVRGLLCYLCNSLIGNAKDDPDVLVRAAEYLAR